MYSGVSLQGIPRSAADTGLIRGVERLNRTDECAQELAIDLRCNRIDVKPLSR
jgi:hypothetical protein